MQETTDQAISELEVGQQTELTTVKAKRRSKWGNGTPSAGRPATRTLFKQFNPEGKYDLNIWKEVFLDSNDPTEYIPAIELAGSWKEWNRIKAGWGEFRNLLAEWKEELAVKMQSDAVKVLVQSRKEAAKMFIAQGKVKVAPPKGKVAKAAKDEDEDDEVTRVMDNL